MPDISFGMQAGQQAAGGILGIGLQSLGAPLQRAQQQKLTNIQTNASKQLLDYQSQKQLEMWRNTNYSAQIEQLKQAGLNPGLLYGIGGGGGTTTGAGTPIAQGAHAATPDAALGLAQSAGQLGLLKAQKENIETDTEAKKAGIPKTQAETTLLQTENQLKNVQLEYDKKSLDDRLDLINTIASKAIAELDITELQRTENRATLLSKIDTIRAQATAASLQNILLETQNEEVKSRITKNFAEISKWSQELLQGWQSLTLKEKEMKVEALIKQVEQIYTGFRTPLTTIRTHNPYSIARQIDEIMGLGREHFKTNK